MVPVVKPPQVSSKERGLQMKWPGSTSDAEQAHVPDKNYLTLWDGTMNHGITERFGLDRTFKDHLVPSPSAIGRVIFL